mmetsp:Transcript_17314/g.37365  ORF Transcript_17314/g.37365 Transcript_17314/m.37365 type:complete len:221 (-) Transcript_17314:1027-1689(-)
MLPVVMQDCRLVTAPSSHACRSKVAQAARPLGTLGAMKERRAPTARTPLARTLSASCTAPRADVASMAIMCTCADAASWSACFSCCWKELPALTSACCCTSVLVMGGRWYVLRSESDKLAIAQHAAMRTESVVSLRAAARAATTRPATPLSCPECWPSTHSWAQSAPSTLHAVARAAAAASRSAAAASSSTRLLYAPAGSFQATTSGRPLNAVNAAERTM